MVYIKNLQTFLSLTLQVLWAFFQSTFFSGNIAHLSFVTRKNWYNHRLNVDSFQCFELLVWRVKTQSIRWFLIQRIAKGILMLHFEGVGTLLVCMFSVISTWEFQVEHLTRIHKVNCVMLVVLISWSHFLKGIRSFKITWKIHWSMWPHTTLFSILTVSIFSINFWFISKELLQIKVL